VTRKVDAMSREVWVVCDQCGARKPEQGAKLQPDSHVPMAVSGFPFDACITCFNRVRAVLPNVQMIQQYVDQVIDVKPISPHLPPAKKGHK